MDVFLFMVFTLCALYLLLAYPDDILGRTHAVKSKASMNTPVVLADGSIPDVIYLQWIEDEEPLDDVTWCADRIHETDIEYRRVPFSPDVSQSGLL